MRLKWQKTHVTAATCAYAQLRLRAQDVTAAKAKIACPRKLLPLELFARAVPFTQKNFQVN